MKAIKKLASMLLAVALAVGVCVPAMAFGQTATPTTPDADNATITISNTAKGETYSVYKLFDATVTGTAGGSIAYTGTIPSSLSEFFLANAAGNIAATAAAKDGDKMSDDLEAALKTWASSQTATASAVSDGTALEFTGLAYGYYVVTTTQGAKSITVTSTNPAATIVDKNSTEPGPDPDQPVKKADGADYNIGDTVTYTVHFKTANYTGTGESAKKIVSYTIEDTLPGFLSNVTVTSIIVDNDGDATTTSDQSDVTAQFVDKKITIDWYDDTNKKFLYDNGATVTVTYTAVVNDTVAIDGAGNKNEVDISWTDEDGNDSETKIEGESTIYSYAIALKKVNDKGAPLAGAVFQLPFYVKATADTDGAYVYAGTTSGDGLTNQLATPTGGDIVIKGVKAGTYSITEVTAPNGYNKLTTPVSVTAAKTGETTTNVVKYLDANGNVTETETNVRVSYDNTALSAATAFVVNKSGTELPSTGGMGTMIFTAVGLVLIVGAGALLVAKRRSNRG